MSRARRLVADRPIAAFLVIGNAVYVAIALVPGLRQTEIWFGLPLFASLGTIGGVGLAAFLVTAATGGRAAIADLLRRSLRWRVPARWYALAIFGVPAATALIALTIYGMRAVESPAGGWPHALAVVLAVFVLQFLLFQLAEEIGWTGFFQERLSGRYGALRLSAIVAFFWALWHVPDFFVDEGWGAQQAVAAVAFLAFEFVVLFFARVLIVWMYERTGRSILIVTLFHASFDATISRLSRELLPGSDAVRFLVDTGVVVLTASAMIVATRGRLARSGDHVPESAAART